MATWNTTATEVTWSAVDDPSVTWTVNVNPTVTGGGGAVDSVNGQTGVVVLDVDDVAGRDIYRPALVMSPASVAAFGGSMVNGVSLTIAALASSIPVGLDILIWNGTNGGAPNGSYTHTGSGSFAFSDRQYLNATSFNDGCVQVVSNDFATTGAAGELSTWGIITSNGTDYGLSAQGGFTQEAGTGHIVADPTPVSADRPVVFAGTTGKVVKQGTLIGSALVNAATTADGRSAIDAAAASHVHDASDITSGTMATARLGSGTANSSTFLRGDQTWAAPPTTVVGTLGTQSAITEATPGWNPGASVGSINLPALADGDLVMFNAVISWVNSSGASRTLRAGVTLGTTTTITAATAGSASGTTREVSVSGFVHVLSTTSQIVSATFIADNTTSFSVAAATTEDVSTAKALGLVAGSNSATGTQSATLRNLHVRRVSA